jgi:hypothetical protein
MGWQHTFIHEVAQRPNRPNGRSYYNIPTPHPSRSHNSATADVETESKLIEHREWKIVHEDVGKL